MRRILIISLSVHWTAVFSLMAIQAASAMPIEPGGLAFAVPTILSVCFAIVTMLFVWSGISAFGRAAPAEGWTNDVTRIAFAAAALGLTLAMLAAQAGPATQTISVTSVQLAALGATYLVIRYEDNGMAQAGIEPNYSHAVARRMAVGAAHSSMLSRLSGRGPNALETDA